MSNARPASVRGPRECLWRFLLRLWPLAAVLALGQVAMHLTGNSARMGLSWRHSLVDALVFLALLTVASWLMIAPLQRALVRGRMRVFESLLAMLPWRVLQGFLAAGVAFSFYLLLVVALVWTGSGQPWSPRLFLAVAGTILYGGCILLPVLAVAHALGFSTWLRRRLAEDGVFLGARPGPGISLPFTSSSRRPWVVFAVTGLVPILMMAGFVALAFHADPGEEHFLLAQASVLIVLAVAAGLDLVWTLSRSLARIVASLREGLDHLSRGNFDARVPVLSDDEMGELARGLNTAMEGLKARAQLEGALEAAAEIQRGLLPRAAPSLPGYSIAGLIRPTEQVGGDCFQYFPAEDGRLWLAVADVSGKGYPAALTMANLQAMLQGLARLNFPIEEAAAYLNDTLHENLTGGRFVTLFLGKLQPESHALVWLNAGHVPPLILRGDSPLRLEAGAPPLGLAPGMSFSVSRTELAPGDLLLICTDGVTEATNAAGVPFGEARLVRFLEENRELPVDELVERLADEVAEYAGGQRADDLTLVAIRRED